MLDEKTRMAVALKRFALISPILNGQVSSIKEYCIKVTEEPIDLPHYGSKSYAPNTIRNWYSDYMAGGIDGLKPKGRSDMGQTRVITPEMGDLILAKAAEYPKAPATIIYDLLVEDVAFLPKDVSLQTVRRFIARNRRSIQREKTPQEMLRFTMEQANDLWQTDLMYGTYVTGEDGKKHQTYLLAYIDDATRLITYGAFFLTQDIRSLRDSFREAVMRRGIPKVLYTDNGKIYRSQAFEYLCAGIGVTLLHHAPYAASSKGKIERFFRTVRMRFMPRLSKEDISSIDALNAKFQTWLEDDYQRRPHDGLAGRTPRECFLEQSGGIKTMGDMAAFNEKFMIRVKRTIKKDATISLDGALYETDMALCGMRSVEVRYAPDTGDRPREIFLFQDDEPLGIAKIVNFTDNAKRKRNGTPVTTNPADVHVIPEYADPSVKEQTITYTEMREGAQQCSHNISD
jgi:transposase InsO family protein